MTRRCGQNVEAFPSFNGSALCGDMHDTAQAYKTVRKISVLILKITIMKKMSFEQMEEVKGGEWCVWGNGIFLVFYTLAYAQSYAQSYGLYVSYCIT
jgi:hypothetical protein